MIDPEERKEFVRDLCEWLQEEEVISFPILLGNAVFGVGPKVAEWEPIAGYSFPAAFNTIKLK
jgi:hypothetical protein